MIYPDRALQELYIQHQSVWDEVWEGLMEAEDALSYMGVGDDSELYEQALTHLVEHIVPL